MTLSVAEYYGPGYWNMIHKQAFDIKNSKREDEFIIEIKKKFIAFPCKSCSDEALKYLRNNDISKMKNIKLDNGKLIGMFYWTFVFHNVVNLKLGKPQMDFEIALTLYEDDEKCEDTCDASKYISKS